MLWIETHQSWARFVIHQSLTTTVVQIVRLREVFTWENSHRREFHTAITLWFCISFTWWLDYFVISLFEGTLHDNKIYVWFKIANITHALPVPVHRFPTETCGRFAFTWYRCEISYRCEILAPVQQPGWTHAGVTGAGMTFYGDIM